MSYVESKDTNMAYLKPDMVLHQVNKLCGSSQIISFPRSLDLIRFTINKPEVITTLYASWIESREVSIWEQCVLKANRFSGLQFWKGMVHTGRLATWDSVCKSSKTSMSFEFISFSSSSSRDELKLLNSGISCDNFLVMLGDNSNIQEVGRGTGTADPYG